MTTQAIVTIDSKKYTATLKRLDGEVIITVYNFPYKDVYGRGSTDVERVSNAKSNFKLQVEAAYDVEVAWG